MYNITLRWGVKAHITPSRRVCSPFMHIPLKNIGTIPVALYIQEVCKACCEYTEIDNFIVVTSELDTNFYSPKIEVVLNTPDEDHVCVCEYVTELTDTITEELMKHHAEAP